MVSSTPITVTVSGRITDALSGVDPSTVFYNVVDEYSVIHWPQAWQTFGRLRFESNQAMQRKRDFSSPLVEVYGDKNDYAL